MSKYKFHRLLTCFRRIGSEVERTAAAEFEAEATAADFMSRICHRCQGMKCSEGHCVDDWPDGECTCAECVDCGEECGEDDILEINGVYVLILMTRVLAALSKYGRKLCAPRTS